MSKSLKRYFQTEVGNFVTRERKIEVGVPQGAVLSPTLFSIYINDIPIEAVDNFSNILFFVDDVMFEIKYTTKTNELEDLINSYLQRLEARANTWGLSFAPYECSYIVFSNTKRHSLKDTFEPSYMGKTFSKKTHPIFLGFKFEPYLSFSKQCEYVREKARNRLNVLKILSHYKTWHIRPKSLVNIYINLIRYLFENMEFTFPFLSQDLKKIFVCSRK